jgi:CheY-like chemotaxis protein
MNDRTILLVEDNPQDEMLTLRALRKVNLANHVDVVRDGQQALDYLNGAGDFAARAGASLPAVVLQRLRNDERTRLLPVVILTSSDEDRDRMRSYENGANSFVRKPLDFGEFAETVARLGVYWLATNEPPLA